MSDEALGRLVRDGDGDGDGHRHELHFTRRFPHPPERVWRALTEPEHLAHWFPSEIRGERRAGAPLEFVFAGAEDEPMPGELVVFEPHRSVEYRWGSERLRFDLDDDGAGGTVLHFVDGFDDLGKAARDGAGWHVCLDALDQHLDGDPVVADPKVVWTAVHHRYVLAFGPEASTVGPPPGHEVR